MKKFSFTWRPNWLHGNPRTRKPSVCSAFSCGYCQVAPQKEARLIINRTLPEWK